MWPVQCYLREGNKGLSNMKLCTAALTLLLATTSAMAADLPVVKSVEPAAPVVTAYNWTGFYVGAQAGYAWGKSDWSGYADWASYGNFFKLDPKGAFGGAYAGYNYQFETPVVLGVEGDINGGDVNAKNVPITGLVVNQHGYSKLKWFGSARIRAGYAIDRFLPYVTGGIAFGNYQYDTVFVEGSCRRCSESANRVGWTIGAGVEYAITDNITARIEYRYSDYGTKKNGITNFAVSDLVSRQVDLKTNDVRVGVAYKF